MFLFMMFVTRLIPTLYRSLQLQIYSTAGSMFVDFFINK